MDNADLGAVWLTLKLASVVTLLLLLVGTPIAWWLARTHSRLKGAIGAIVSLPLVLPPTVLGFYLLVAMGPKGPVGQLTEALGLGILPFTFPAWSLPRCFIPCRSWCNRCRTPSRPSASGRSKSPPRCVPAPRDRFWSVVAAGPAGLPVRRHHELCPYRRRVRRGTDDRRQYPGQDPRCSWCAHLRPRRGARIRAGTRAGLAACWPSASSSC